MDSGIKIGLQGSGQVQIGDGKALILICGPCVIESRDHLLKMAEKISEIARQLEIGLVLKSSYDKANRTSLDGYRGLGIEEGLRILDEARNLFGVPIVTDVHTEEELQAAADVVDLIQIPAFLCRQTSLLLAAGKANKPVMIKKAQFLHPADLGYAVKKIRSQGNMAVILCERGSCFGYRELVVDFRSLEMMKENSCPIVFDATHSVQVMGGGKGASSGYRQYVPVLSRAAVAVGIDGIFLECHDQPEIALSDGPNMVRLSELPKLLSELKALDEFVREQQNIGARVAW